MWTQSKNTTKNDCNYFKKFYFCKEEKINPKCPLSHDVPQKNVCPTNKSVMNRDIVWPISFKGESPERCRCTPQVNRCEGSGTSCMGGLGKCRAWQGAEDSTEAHGVNWVCRKYACNEGCPNGTQCREGWCEPTFTIPVSN